jgi:hypothetical protein
MSTQADVIAPRAGDTRRMPLRRLALTALLLLLTSCAGHSAAWKAADLDRNEFDLGLSRGAVTAEVLADWGSHGEVVEASGDLERDAGIEIIVRYETEHGSFMGDVETDLTCYRFIAEDRHGVEFDETDCPD